MKFGFAAFWFVFCAAFMAFGIYRAADQHQKLTRFLPVKATVKSTKVESRHHRSRDGSSVTYLPVVHYEYDVDGLIFESESVFPVDVGRGSRWGRRWARSVVKGFRKNQRTGAFYDPLDPTRAFLIKQPSAFPYCFILLPAILGIVGLAGFTAGKQPTPEPIKRRRALYFAGAWHAVGLLSAGHYFTLAGSNYGDFALPVFGGYTFLGLVPILFALPSEGVGGRFKAAGAGSLIGGFLGFWCGLCSGWLAAFFSDRQLGGPSWMMYGVLIGAGILAFLGFFTGKVHSS